MRALRIALFFVACANVEVKISLGLQLTDLTVTALNRAKESEFFISGFFDENVVVLGADILPIEGNGIGAGDYSADIDVGFHKDRLIGSVRPSVMFFHNQCTVLVFLIVIPFIIAKKGPAVNQKIIDLVSKKQYFHFF